MLDLLTQITTFAFTKHMNEVLFPALDLDSKPNMISERTARRWLHKLGYQCKEVAKGKYYDGHERPDVIRKRKEYLVKMSEETGYGRYVDKLNSRHTAN